MAFVVCDTSFATLTLKHVERRSDGSFQYRRRIPQDLRHRYAGKTFIVRSLGKDFETLQARSVALTTQLEKDWHSFRNPNCSDPVGSSTKNALDSVSASPVIEFKRDSDLTLNSDIRTECKSSLTITGSLALYLGLHPKGKDRKFRENNDRVVRNLINRIGNLDLSSISRSHAEDFRDFSLRKQSTATVRRNLHSLTAIVNKVRKEKQLQILNPFEGLGIVDEGEDGKKRIPFDSQELRIIAEACRNIDDDIRHIIALQMDSGCRVAEVVGLRVENVILDQPIPHVRIRPWGKVRTLKTAASERDIPLVGNALWAAGRAVKARRKAPDGSPWLFPRYASDREVKATHASNALNKWLRSLEGVSSDKTTHCFRHAMRDRLRAAQVPHDIQEAIGGWGTRTIGQGYGNGYPLKVLSEHMKRSIKSRADAVPIDSD